MTFELRGYVYKEAGHPSNLLFVHLNCLSSTCRNLPSKEENRDAPTHLFTFSDSGVCVQSRFIQRLAIQAVAMKI